jgi:hypothetical protein
VAETAIRVVPADGFVCHEGNSDDHWLGVVDGLVKIASVPLEGKSMSFVGVPTAGWFGEGSRNWTGSRWQAVKRSNRFPLINSGMLFSDHLASY